MKNKIIQLPQIGDKDTIYVVKGIECKRIVVNDGDDDICYVFSGEVAIFYYNKELELWSAYDNLANFILINNINMLDLEPIKVVHLG